MLEKQRVHLEELIDNRVRYAVQAEQRIGTKWEGASKVALEQVEAALEAYLDFIQDYVGTLCAMTPGGLDRWHKSLDYITREEKDE
tara:strand:+ start:324 stop:581 length:258 start_codon:yes stop_codon:yes gene_type:complete